MEKSKKVKCVFQGHEHKGGYEQINGIHYYTLKGLIEGDFPASNSFAIVTLVSRM
jgi:alkaline phosphatase